MIDNWPVDPVSDEAQPNWELLKKLLSIFAAPGILYPYMGSTAPNGTVFAIGQAVVPHPAFPRLRKLLVDSGNPFGVSGSDPLLPDMRGRAPIGAGTGSGLTPRTLGSLVGTETHVLTTAQMPSHSHGGSTGVASAHADNQVYGHGGGTNFQVLAWAGAFIGADNQKFADLNHAHGIAAEGGGSSHPNMQPSIPLNWFVILQ